MFFNRLARKIKEAQAKKVSQPQKLGAVYSAVKRICRENQPSVAIPAFQCAVDAIEKMRESRMIDYYFLNRKEIYSFCKAQNYI